MTNELTGNDALATFEGKKVRKVWFNNKWYFSIEDVVSALTDSVDAKQYIKKIRKREPELNSNWGTICTLLQMLAKDGKNRKIMTSDVKGLLRIIQSIPSPKAEPMKQWLARIGYERIQEYEDPSLAVDRARKYYKKLGRPESWIQQRILEQNIRNNLTDYWSDHKIKEGKEFAILTDIIHKEWSDMTVRQHKNLKNLNNQNLRDHMTDAELVFTALAELSTRQVAEHDNAIGMGKNKIAAQEGGRIAKKARKELEKRTGQQVISNSNFIDKDQTKKLKIVKGHPHEQ